MMVEDYLHEQKTALFESIRRQLKAAHVLLGDDRSIDPEFGFPRDLIEVLGIKKKYPAKLLENGFSRELDEMLRIPELTVREAITYHQARWQFNIDSGLGPNHELGHLILGLTKVVELSENGIGQYQNKFNAEPYVITLQTAISKKDYPADDKEQEKFFVERVRFEYNTWQRMVEGWRTVRHLLGITDYKAARNEGLQDNGKGFNGENLIPRIKFLNSDGTLLDGRTNQLFTFSDNWRILVGDRIYCSSCDPDKGNMMHVQDNPPDIKEGYFKIVGLPEGVEPFQPKEEDAIRQVFSRVKPYIDAARKDGLIIAYGDPAYGEPQHDRLLFRTLVTDAGILKEDNLPPLTTGGAADERASNIAPSSQHGKGA